MTLNLSPVDLLVVLAYLLGTFAIAWRVRSHQKTTEDYYLAGRSIPWVVVSLSLFATLFSTISFVSVPGEAYKNGALYFLRSPAYLVGLPVAIALFLRYFYTKPRFTAYEYLEERFDRNVRLVGSGVFLIVRGFYAATVLYAASKIFVAFVGFSELQVIVVVGIFSIAYTTVGGMRAVMYTDVFQSIVLFIGLGGVLYKVLAVSHFDVAGIYSFGQAHDHTFGALASGDFYSLSPWVRYTVWLLLIDAFLHPLSNVGADQLTVQRLLSGKGYSDARKALWVKGFMGVGILAALYFIGLAMFRYYNGGGGTLPEGMGADRVLGHFVITELPAPFPGLLAAALLSALMSTVDSTINSLATVTGEDILVRFRRKSKLAHVTVAKLLTVFWGAVILGLACFLSTASTQTETTVLEVNNVWATLWHVLLMVFLLAVLTRRITARGVFWGALLGTATNLVLPWVLYYNTPPEARISFAWLGVPGFLITGIVAAAVSYLAPGRPKGDAT